MAISAADVKSLRDKTGVGMMDCKRALAEADGDFECALENLRERGLAAATKKAGRITAEGVVLAYQAGDVSVLVEVNSETDFVGKNPEFQAFVLDIAKTIAAGDPADVEALLAMQLAGAGRTVEETRQEKVLSIGENLSVRRFTRIAGNPAVASYIHGGGSMGVLAVFSTDAATALLKAMFSKSSTAVSLQRGSFLPLSFGSRSSIKSRSCRRSRAVSRLVRTRCVNSGVSEPPQSFSATSCKRRPMRSSRAIAAENV